MTAANIVLLVLYAVGMSIGQLLFKMAADHAKSDPGASFLISVFGSLSFYIAVLVYAVLTLAWVWLLMRIPLSRAYPFVVLAFVVTPLLAALFFGESLNIWYFLGLALVVGGLTVLVSKAA